MTIRARRLAAAGALAVAAVAAPTAIALTGADAAVSNAQCRAHFGNIEDNICMDGPDNGNSFTIGSPDIGIIGPNGVSRGGIGVTTGSLLPSQTFTQPLG